MKMQRLFIRSFSITFLLISSVAATPQMSESAARERANDVVRSKLNLRPKQFLDVRRDEELEQSLALVANKQIGQYFIYRLSSSGYEMNEKGIIHHTSIDGESSYIIVVNHADGNTYRIRGFSDSLKELQKLILELGVKITSADQAEAVAQFYREVNPENRSMAPISSMFDLKQAAERQCQTIPFELGESEFEEWWKRTGSLFAKTPFAQTAVPHDGGYLVEWVVLSSAGAGACGGAPLRAGLQVNEDGQLGKLSFVPLRRK